MKLSSNHFHRDLSVTICSLTPNKSTQLFQPPALYVSPQARDSARAWKKCCHGVRHTARTSTPPRWNQSDSIYALPPSRVLSRYHPLSWYHDSSTFFHRLNLCILLDSEHFLKLHVLQAVSPRFYHPRHLHLSKRLAARDALKHLVLFRYCQLAQLLHFCPHRSTWIYRSSTAARLKRMHYSLSI